MSEFSEESSSAKRAEEFLQVFKKGAEFTQSLLKENERLRYQILKLKEPAAQDMPSPAQLEELQRLRQQVAELEREKQEILDRIKAVEEENHDFANRYVVVESENNMLANLYIASYQLHSTLDFKEVLQIISEIVINLIGAEVFAVLLLDEKTGKLELAGHEGIDVSALPPIDLGAGVIGRAGQTGENHFVEDIEAYELDYSQPMACIPLKIKEHVIGVIVIYRLLEQKRRFADVDYELFTLLAGHAATAIFSSRLYSESERKLSTIQGFINLLTK
ncbi:GAF domain-containing protein [Desulfuromonas acetexigens]|uniref:GAF domain-containing protein n=1 Tax=Trichloromonas acetexigens TaxID=38815 RepID=A0A550JKT9_9BACT|nr:GAF domain-containing protein [Desulfuromonas acetexigens]TRO83829.1 GAF domain-containing protein [Desulfuromonas acetexigens]